MSEKYTIGPKVLQRDINSGNETEVHNKAKVYKGSEGHSKPRVTSRKL